MATKKLITKKMIREVLKEYKTYRKDVIAIKSKLELQELMASKYKDLDCGICRAIFRKIISKFSKVEHSFYQKANDWVSKELKVDSSEYYCKTPRELQALLVHRNVDDSKYQDIANNLIKESLGLRIALLENYLLTSKTK